jgi:hypothetical protein
VLLIALSIVTFALIAMLAHMSLCARRLERNLDAMLIEQVDRLDRIERDVDRVRQALDSVDTSRVTIDIRRKTGGGADALLATRDPGMRSTDTLH